MIGPNITRWLASLLKELDFWIDLAGKLLFRPSFDISLLQSRASSVCFVGQKEPNTRSFSFPTQNETDFKKSKLALPAYFTWTSALLAVRSSGL